MATSSVNERGSNSFTLNCVSGNELLKIVGSVIAKLKKMVVETKWSG